MSDKKGRDMFLLSEVRAFLTKMMPKRVLYWQVVFTLFAFAAMVIISYFIMSTAIRSHLSQKSDAALDLAMSKIDAELRGPETTLRAFAETVQQRIVQGADVNNIREFMFGFNTHLSYHAKDETSPVTLFGAFYTFGADPVIMHSSGWIPFAGYDHQSRPWYRAAVKGGGSPARSELYLDYSVEQYVFAIAQSIYDESGRQLGVVSLQVPIDFIGEIVIQTAKDQGGYGMILGQDMKVYAHANRGFVGMEVPDPALPFSIFYNQFINGEDIFEHPMTNFAGESSLAFFRKTQDGWYYGTVVPSAPYYKSITNIWYALVALGVAAAAFLIYVLASTDAKKNRVTALANALNKMSEIFLTQSGNAFEDTMSAGGRLLADLAEVDRFSLLRSSIEEDDTLYMSQIYRWEAALGGSTKPNEKFVHVPFRKVAPEWERMFREGGQTLNGPTRLMPEHEAALFKGIGARSAFVAPIHINGVPWGFVLFEDQKKERVFDKNLAETMQSAAFLFANAVARAELEDQLASERDFTQKIIDAAPIGLNIWDDNFNLVSCNDAIENIFGCTKQYYTENFNEFSPEYQSGGIKSADKVKELQSRVRNGEIIVSEWEHLTATGETVPCEITMTRMDYSNKQIVVVYLYDLRNIKNMEKVILKAEQTRVLIDATPLSCTLLDRDANVLTCNKSAEEFFKLSKKEDIQRMFVDLMPEYQPNGNNSKETAAEALRKAYDDGYVFIADWTHRSLDGEPLPCEVTLVRVEYGGGYVIAGYARDMRAVKAAEAKASEADERIKAMFDAMPLCSNIWNKDGLISDVNEETLRLFDLKDKREFVDRFNDLSPEYQPDGRPSAETATSLIAKAYKEGYCRFEWMMQKLSGEPIPVEVTLIRIKHQDDYIVATYFRDLRELKESIAKTREADERAQMMLEQTPLVVMLWDKDANILDCNQEAVRVTGLSSKKEYVERLFELTPDTPDGMKSSEAAKKAIALCLETGSVRIPWALHHAVTGELIPFDVTIARVKYKGEDAVISYAQDVRERNAAIEKMREADDRARVMIEQAPLVVMLWDKDANILDCNQEAIGILGLSSKQEYIEKFFEIAPDQPNGMTSLEAAKMLLSKTLETGFERVEWVLNHPETGEAIPFESIIVRIKYKDEYILMSYGQDVRERYAAIAKMREADERAQLMLEQAPLVVMLWNKNYQIIDCNQEAVRLFNMSSKQEYMERFFSLAPEYQPNGMTSMEMIQKVFTAAFETGYGRDEWMHYQASGGELIPFDVTVVRIKYGNEYAVLTYAQDLRELRASIAKIREADERAQIMFDVAPYACCLYDKTGDMIDCNQEILKMFGITDKEYYFKRASELSPEYQLDGELSARKADRNGSLAIEKGVHRFEWTHKKMNGELFPAEITMVRVNYKGEHAIAGYIRDLTEQKAKEQLTKEVTEKSSTLTAILDTTPDLIFCKDLDSRYTLCNKSFENLVNIPREDIIGKGDAEGLNAPPEVAEAFIAEDKKIFGTNQVVMFEDYLLSHDGKRVLFETLKAPLVINGKVTGLVGIARDITQRKELARQQAEAEAASHAKSLFLANMSHEMRTPMNVIVGLTDLMLEEESVPEKIKETLSKINTAGNTLTGLINDVLDISKIEEGKLELTPITYDVPSLFNDIITLNIIRIEEKPITFKLDIDESLPCTLFGDDLRVKQILNNLLSNAFKYTKEGTVTMSVSHRREDNDIWLSFSISDTGIGIREEDLKKLFTNYTQVDTHANREIGGTGLGLSITKKLAEMMNGEISVQSEYGKGTVFTAVICQGFVTEKNIGAEVVENLRSFQYFDKKKQEQGKLVRSDLSYACVLVVDDLQMNLEVAAGMLRKYKMKVDCVLSGQESINLIAAKEPVYDAIFMDHMMPGMDGIEATKRIRNLGTEYAQNIPIIALTANAVEGNEQMFIENGFSAFLPKPFSALNLDKVIQRWVRDKSREQ
jgi:PAS domain S-box-containing protein